MNIEDLNSEYSVSWHSSSSLHHVQNHLMTHPKIPKEVQKLKSDMSDKISNINWKVVYVMLSLFQMLICTKKPEISAQDSSMLQDGSSSIWIRNEEMRTTHLLRHHSIHLLLISCLVQCIHRHVWWYTRLKWNNVNLNNTFGTTKLAWKIPNHVPTISASSRVLCLLKLLLYSRCLAMLFF